MTAEHGPINPGPDPAVEVWHRNDAIDHLDEIRVAYWSGRSVSDLAEQWGVSQLTITIWVYGV